MSQRKAGATLYVRGVPEQLVRAAKSVAAQRGITLTALVVESLTHTVQPGPTEEQPPEPDLEADWAWYEAHRNDLAAGYSDEYVAIVDGQVVDHDPEFAALAPRVFTRYEQRSVLMPRCVPNGRTVNLPSPRVQRW